MLASDYATLPPPDDPTQGLLFLLAVAAAGFGLGALQYRTRRRLVSVPVAAGGLVLAALALPYWPIPLFRIQSPLPAWTDRPDALQHRTRLQARAAVTVDPLGEAHWQQARESSLRPMETGCHHGYERLADAVTHERRLRLDKRSGALEIVDRLSGSGDHELRWRFHLAPGVDAEPFDERTCRLSAAGRRWTLQYPPGLDMVIVAAADSPSYGVTRPCLAIVW